jgi:hypothetical protein
MNAIARTQPIPHPQRPATDQLELLSKLTRQVRGLEIAGRQDQSTATISSGATAIDELLPERGYAAGSLVEFLSSHSGGCGTWTLMLLAARQAISSALPADGAAGNADSVNGQSLNGKYIVVVDPVRQFYPPAAIAFGIDPAMVIVLHPSCVADHVWAVDQSLRCPAVGAVVSKFDQLDDRDARRLQLAAEGSGCLGLFERVDTGRSLPSWAEIQWRVTPAARFSKARSRTRESSSASPAAVQLARQLAGEAPESLSQASNAASMPRKRMHSPLQNNVAAAGRATSSRAGDRPPWAWDNSRWVDLELVRCRNGRGSNRRLGSRISLVLDGYSGEIMSADRHESMRFGQSVEARDLDYSGGVDYSRDVNESSAFSPSSPSASAHRESHESTSSLRLVAELAVPADRSSRAGAVRPPHRAASA